MNKKLTFTVTVLAGLMFGAGATTIADNVWQGHQNIVESKNIMDKLTAMIHASNCSLSDLQDQNDLLEFSEKFQNWSRESEI